MYEDPQRWAYLFQSYVLLTMMEAHAVEQVSPRPAPLGSPRLRAGFCAPATGTPQTRSHTAAAMPDPHRALRLPPALCSPCTQTKLMRVMERSVYSARWCFIENLRKR